MQQIKLGEITIEVIQKDIKNLHLSVHPPKGRVKIAAPLRMDLDTIRVFAISKLSWIRKQQVKLLKQEREAPRDYITQESHYYLGKRYLLKVIEHEAPPKVTLKHGQIELHIRPDTDIEKRQIILESWYREKLRERIAGYVEKWQGEIGVNVNEFAIKKMKTKWGTCNQEAKRIWVNLELAKKPLECIEYIVVHEMVHLLERNHKDRFISYMDIFLPRWRAIKEDLNRMPVSHSDWKY